MSKQDVIEVEGTVPEALPSAIFKVQLENGLPQSKNELSESPDFEIEMETGTGKTYVYLKTILELKKKYSFSQPFTKESLLYREIFESFYPGQAEMVVDFWMPNKEWEGCNVNDPSARVLANYGDSGV